MSVTENTLLQGCILRFELKRLLSEQFTEKNKDIYFQNKADDANTKAAVLANVNGTGSNHLNTLKNPDNKIDKIAMRWFIKFYLIQSFIKNILKI